MTPEQIAVILSALDAIEAAKRNIWGLPLLATASDTHKGPRGERAALWADNGMAGIGQVAVSNGEFPDKSLSAVAAMVNAAAAIGQNADAIRELLEASNEDNG